MITDTFCFAFITFHREAYKLHLICRIVAKDKGIKGNDLEAAEPEGECILGTGYASKQCSVHQIKLELLMLKAKKIMMTLDCCRTPSREGFEFPPVTDLL